jgi:two-component system response regulator (stage 0 sporulation protein A)
MRKEVQKIIRQFRVTSKYKGYLLIIDATLLYLEKDFIQITKDIYPTLAQKHNMSTTSIERDIRTVVETCWKNNRRAVQEIMSYDIVKCPTNSEFLDAIAYFITNKKG